MKKILLLCVTMIAVTMVLSCSKDNEELIVGKWRIQSLEGMNVGQTISDGSEDEPTPQIVYEDNWGWVFNADGTGYSYEIQNGIENTLSNLTYTIDGDSLHIKYTNSITIDKGIENLNRRVLRLSERFELTDVDGNFVRYEYGYMNFKKQ